MTKGEDLFASLNGVRAFLNDLSQLLLASDMLMAARAWEPVGDNSCLNGLSYSVYEGRRWLPRAAFRRYTNAEDYPGMLAMTSLLLDEHDEYKLTEPLVCGLYFVFPEETPKDEVSVEPWNALWPGWMEAPKDGSPVVLDENYEYWKQKWGFRYAKMFARPLVDVANQDALNEKVIQPLQAMIDAHVNSAGQVAKRK